MGENIHKSYLTKDSYLKYAENAQNWMVKKNHDPFRRWAKDTKRHFTKDDIQIVNKHMKGCLISHLLEQWKGTIVAITNGGEGVKITRSLIHSLLMGI